MKSVTDLSFVFCFFVFFFKQTVFHPLDNIPRERHFCPVGFCSTCIWGLGLCACMSHLRHVPSILTDRKHISYISCLASCCRGTNCSALKVRSSLSSVFEVSFQQTSRSARFSWRLRDVLYNRIRGGFEESACCLQETVLIMAEWKEGGMDQARQ